MKDDSKRDAEKLADEARSKPGEIPNRDEDEFSDDGLKAPPVDPDLHELADGDDENQPRNDAAG